MKVLVTGAHGFIGSHLCDYLLAHDYEVKALVSPWGKLDNLKDSLEHKGLEVVRADIAEAETLKGICKACDAVVHAAARVADWGHWKTFEHVNVRGTEHLLAEALSSSVTRFVLVSSVAVHRYTGFRNADSTELPRDNWTNPYARSKIMAEDAVFAAGLEGVAIRPGLWPFGPRDPNFQRIVKNLKLGVLPLVGSGETVINTAYVGNLVAGLERALRAPLKQQAYVIADEGTPSWAEVFVYLAEVLGVPPPRLRLPPQLVVPLAHTVENVWQQFAPRTEPPLTRYRAELMLNDVHFSTKAAQADLGCAPEVSWQEGLTKTVAYL